MVACGVSFNNGDCRANDTNAAVRIQRIRVGDWNVMPNSYGCCNLLLLLPHV